MTGSLRGHGPDTVQALRASVIIPTRDRTEPLLACLRVLATDFPPETETIVVSDGGSTYLEPVVREFGGPLRLRVLEVPHGGPAFARNRGLEVAAGRVAIFTDDDCRPRANWVEQLLQRVSCSPPIAAGGITQNGKINNPYADVAQLILDLVATHEINCCGERRFFPTNNIAFPTDTLRRLGGFDEAFETAEDRELLRRWRGAGFPVVTAPGAVVDHDANPDLLGFVRKFYRYGKGAARFHRTAVGPSFGDALGFHRRLPDLLGPALRRRGLGRGLAALGLLGVWELANLAGCLVETTQHAIRRRNWASP